MGKMGHMLRNRQQPDATTAFMADAHIYAGFTVLALIIIRLVLRFTHGAPEAPAGTKPIAALVAKALHALFYLLLIAAPVSGALVVYGGLGELAGPHHLLKPVFIFTILLHVVAALWHQYGLKDGLMRRMMTSKA